MNSEKIDESGTIDTKCLLLALSALLRWGHNSDLCITVTATVLCINVTGAATAVKVPNPLSQCARAWLYSSPNPSALEIAMVNFFIRVSLSL